MDNSLEMWIDKFCSTEIIKEKTVPFHKNIKRFVSKAINS